MLRGSESSGDRELIKGGIFIVVVRGDKTPGDVAANMETMGARPRGGGGAMMEIPPSPHLSNQEFLSRIFMSASRAKPKPPRPTILCDALHASFEVMSIMTGPKISSRANT